MNVFIADLLGEFVAGLGALSLSQPFAVRARYVPKAKLAELETLTVTAVPISHPMIRATREAYQRDTVIQCGVQQKLTGTLEEELIQVDGLISFCEELAGGIDQTMKELLSERSKLVGLLYEPIYDRRYMDEDRVFSGVISATYRNFD